MNKIKAAVFAFASVNEVKGHAEYNWWHSSDHIPENLGVPGVEYGTRYVATPDLIAARPSCDPSMAGVQYLVSYFHGGDNVDQTIHDFHQRGNQLRAIGRDFTKRKIHFASPFYFDKGYVAPRLPISPEALVYRPHKGVHITLLDLVDASQARAVAEYYDKVHFPDMLTLKGFAGAWRFVSHGGVYSNFNNPIERFMHVYFLDEDPTVALADLRATMPKWVAAGRALDTKSYRIVLAGSFRTIVHKQYDWFGK